MFKLCLLDYSLWDTKPASIMLLQILIGALLVGQSAADLQKGRQLFEGLCARCHGFDGTGGEGPNLNRPALPRAPDDEALRAVIRDGIPERGMPRVRRTTDSEQRQLVAYVRSLGRVAPVARTGDVPKGRALYQRSGCSSCHVIDGEGGAVGPELTIIGMQRGPGYLRQAIIDPAAALPRGAQLVPARNLDEFLPVRVVTRDGREVRGARINEDSFTIQLRDMNDQFHSFRKSELRQIEKEFGKSLMPPYKERLTGSEIDDLVAYLSSLGGAN
jgi:cytochrome c oxidase cbb3-type subunit 3